MKVEVLFWIGRIIAVVALLCVAAAVATPPDRLPLALRGIQRILRKDGVAIPGGASAGLSPQRRLVAFVLVLLAALVALI